MTAIRRFPVGYDHLTLGPRYDRLTEQEIQLVAQGELSSVAQQIRERTGHGLMECATFVREEQDNQTCIGGGC